LTECSIDYNDYFYYDESSYSCLRWKIDHNKSLMRDCVGWKNKGGYWKVSLNIPKSQTSVHRIIILMDNHIPSNYIVDHLDGNPSNNLKTNLRVCTPSDNMKNKRVYKNNISGISGVYLDNNLKGNCYWVVQWVDTEGKRRRKKFVITEPSLSEEVKQKAINERIKIHTEILMNLGYTENHGR
jgi:hypothetical protein